MPYSGQKPFYGWIIVSVGFISQLAQGLVNQGFSTYPELLQREFGWSKAVLAGPRSVTSVQNSVLGPVTGFLIDRLGTRIVFGAGILITGLGLIVFGMTHSLWVYYLSNVLMALGLSLEGILVMSVTVNNWFKRRSTVAESIMLLGYSLAGVIGVPALVLMQTHLGWRQAATWTGIAIIAVGLPCSILLRTRPEPFGLLPDGDVSADPVQSADKPQAGAEHDFTLKTAIRTRAFWLLAFGWAIGNLGLSTVQVHIFLHLGQDVGLSRTAAALVWSIASLANIPSRIIGGILGDRLPKNIILGVATAFMGASVFALAIATSFSTALLFSVPFGIGWGMFTPVMNSVQGDYFRGKSQGVIRGWLQLVSLPFTIAAPVLVGLAADRQGTYLWAFITTSVVMMGGAILNFVATRPKPPVGTALSERY